MTNPARPEFASPESAINRVADIAVRLTVLAALAAWCFLLLRPFVPTILWGGILAVALQPLFVGLVRLLGGRTALAATLIGAGGLVVILGPISVLAASFASGIEALATAFASGRIEAPPPPDWLAQVPFFGTKLHGLWALASVNLLEASDRLAPLVQDVGTRLLDLAGAAGLTVLEFAAAAVVAAVLLPHAGQANASLAQLVERLAPAKGAAFVTLAARTVRNVARGVIGVALLQGLALGAGFLLADIPLPGLWAFLCMALSIAQIGTAPVAIGTIVYAWSALDPVTATVFTVWTVLCSLIDNVLKPILMARGLPTPMAVIVLGLLGGTLLHGLVGLFVGPVVLAAGYDLLRVWMEAPERADPGPADAS